MDDTGHDELQVEVTEESIDGIGKGRRDKVDSSHRVIEKRRRDRINNSLIQLSKLVPIDQFNKKNSGKLEKAEILELTVNYLTQQKQQQNNKETAEFTCQHPDTNYQSIDNNENTSNDFMRGFKECIENATNFFEEVEELDVSEGRCYRLIQHLKKQVLIHEIKDDSVPSKDPVEEFVLVDHVSENAHTSKLLDQNMPFSTGSTTLVESENAKRKSEGQETIANKRSRMSIVTHVKSELQTPDKEEPALLTSPIIEAPISAANQSNNLRNFMPLFLPNMPFFPTVSAGANGMPRYESPPKAQFQGYPFLQSATPCIPVALPQLPFVGMNFMPGFSIVNTRGDQQSNNATPPSDDQTVSGFLPSMYTNGIHANLMAMRPHDSGYDSSDKSSTKGSLHQNSPQSFSDESSSCQSFSST